MYSDKVLDFCQILLIFPRFLKPIFLEVLLQKVQAIKCANGALTKFPFLYHFNRKYSGSFPKLSRNHLDDSIAWKCWQKLEISFSNITYLSTWLWEDDNVICVLTHKKYFRPNKISHGLIKFFLMHGWSFEESVNQINNIFFRCSSKNRTLWSF